MTILMGKIFRRALGPLNLMTDSKQACFCKVALTQLVTKGVSKAARSVTVSGMDCDRMETEDRAAALLQVSQAVSLPLGGGNKLPSERALTSIVPEQSVPHLSVFIRNHPPYLFLYCLYMLSSYLGHLFITLTKTVTLVHIQ